MQFVPPIRCTRWQRIHIRATPKASLRLQFVIQTEMPPKPRQGVLRYVFRAPGYLYRWRIGFLLGHRFLLLTHTGRRSGLPRQTVLEVMEYRSESGEAIVMSGFGRDSNWLLNISANSNEEIQLGSRHFHATHRMLNEDEAIRVLGGYERRNWLVAPIVRRVLSWLTGWPYHGTEEDRRRVVKQLPLIAFRPRA